MKLSWGFVLSSLYCSASASKVGQVYIYDPVPKASSQAASSVSPETARLILAQRLGLSRFHSLKNANDEVIQQLNAYGGKQQKLLDADHPPRNQARVLVWVEDVKDTADIIKDPSAYSAAFTMTDPPAFNENERLLQDMALQAESLPKYPDPVALTYTSGMDVESLMAPFAHTYNDYLTIVWLDTSSISSEAVSRNLARLLAQASDGRDGFSVTVVLMPNPSPQVKRSVKPYGTYDVPSNIEARREKAEALLSPSSSEPSMSPVPNVSDLEDFPVITQAEDTSPVLGILKTCYTSLTACQKQTHNCTGHGACKRLHKGSKGSDSQTNDCYGCACVPTVVKVGPDHGMESKFKTTYWGGPACQKKDVSIPFWLFVGTGVMIAFLIASGIGLMYSMGSEELPSVIGAGVSGPQRK